jgi:hypothetical protein
MKYALSYTNNGVFVYKVLHGQDNLDKALNSKIMKKSRNKKVRNLT